MSAIMEPIPEEVLQEAKIKMRQFYGTSHQLPLTIMAEVWARGVQYGRHREKEEFQDERAEYEAERAEYEQDRDAVGEPITIDLNFQIPDRLLEEIKERFLAAARSGRVELAPEPATITPLKELLEAARKEERQRIRERHRRELGLLSGFHVVCCLDKPRDLLLED